MTPASAAGGAVAVADTADVQHGPAVRHARAVLAVVDCGKEDASVHIGEGLQLSAVTTVFRLARTAAADLAVPLLQTAVLTHGLLLVVVVVQLAAAPDIVLGVATDEPLRRAVVFAGPVIGLHDNIAHLFWRVPAGTQRHRCENAGQREKTLISGRVHLMSMLSCHSIASEQTASYESGS